MKKLRAKFLDANKGAKFTYLPIIIKAFSWALQEFPIVNAIVSPKKDEQGYITEYIEKADHNISIAIDSPNGLIVPNIKKCQLKSIL